MEPPEPHPLDYDWRFAPATARRLADLMLGRGAALCVGAPSVASLLEEAGVGVLLVDRQPLQPVREQVLKDPGVDAPLAASFLSSVVDPPWYPEVYRRWIAWTAAHVGRGGEILASLWPPETRPAAAEEREAALVWIGSWAEVETETDALRYDAPAFELAAARAGGAAPADPQWRTGDLLRIRPKATPVLPPPIAAADSWVRFVFNDYQLALRVRAGDGRPPRLLTVPGAEGWVWPSVSRRAGGRDRIDLWSSRNEVASVEGGPEVLEQIQSIVRTDGMTLRQPPSEVLQTLTSWQIPAGPYWRTLQWSHRA